MSLQPTMARLNLPEKCARSEHLRLLRDTMISASTGCHRTSRLNEDITLQRIACSALVRLTLLAASSMLAASRAVAQNATLHGVVYADANANGKRDASEHGVSGVIVSNQRDAVVTDSLGRFEIPAGTTGIVVVSVPDGFRSSGAFWRATTAAHGSRREDRCA